MSVAFLSTSDHSAAMNRLIQAAVIAAEMHPDRVGERVTAMRVGLGFSKAGFADSIGLDRSTLSKVEMGKKGLDIVVAARIADLYGFGLDFTYRGLLTDAPEALRSRVLAEMHAARAEGIERRFPRD